MSGLNTMIDGAVRCVRCNRPKAQGCGCWSQCACGWWKERGAPGCQRCLAVTFTKDGTSHYAAEVPPAMLYTHRLGIHWTYSVRYEPGGPVCASGVRTNTNKNAKALGVAGVFRAQDAEREFGIAAAPRSGETAPSGASGSGDAT